MSSLTQIKALRDKTGAGIVDVKKALDEAQGDEKKAIELLRKRGSDKAMKKSDRTAAEGIIGTYVHTDQKSAAMVVLKCETDFVARNEDFQALARDIAMHITAMMPTCIAPEDVSDDVVAKEKDIWRAQLSKEGKPEEIMDKIMEGKEQKFRQEQALLTQAFVKDPEKTIKDLIDEAVIKIGEKIEIGAFQRFAL